MDGDVMGATTTKPGLQKLRGIPAIKLVLAAMICLGVVALPALADTNDQPKVTTSAVAKAYQIPSGMLRNALKRFAKQAGITLYFKGVNLKGVTTQGLSGNYTTKDGLDRLLAEAGLYAVPKDKGYLIQKVSPAVVASNPTSNLAPIESQVVVPSAKPIEKVSPAVVASNPTPNLAPIESQVVVPVVSSAKPIEKETTLPVASKPSPSPDKGRNANDPNVSGKVMAVRWCATCHGKDGQARSPIFPRLAGQQRDYIVAQLHDLRDRSRSDRAAIVYMWGVARNLTDKQIYELADYFSSQKPMRGQRSNSPLLAMGQKIFEQGIPGGVACNSCHGLDGGGMGEIPRIAGQHSEYILNQIIAYQNPNDRALMEVGGNTWAPEMQALHRNPERGRGSMASTVKDLSPAEAEAVAIYVSTMNQ
jgi:cytochrome c553